VAAYMQCVILAAGEGRRMRPLTLKTPKPLLPVNGKPLLEHIINALPPEISEIILVVGYLGDQIKNYCGNISHGKRISYVIQKEMLGTYKALELCRPLLGNDLFLMMYADDLFSLVSIKKLLAKRDLAILVKEVPDPRPFAAVLVNADGSVKEIEEKPQNPKSNLANTGPAVLDQRIFEFPASRSPKGEYYLTDSTNNLARHYKVYAIEADWWLPIARPEDLKNAEEFLKFK